MSKSKIKSIITRMHDNLHPPTFAEGFDEIIHVTGTEDTDDGASEVLARIWALSIGESPK